MSSESLQQQVGAETVLEDNLLHPIVSPLQRIEDRTVFWISGLAESPDEPVDHDTAQSHRVDLEIDTWMRDEGELYMSGWTAGRNSQVLYHVHPIGDKLYMGSSKALIDYFERHNQD